MTHAHTFCVTKVVVWMLLNIHGKHVYLAKRKRKSKAVMLITKLVKDDYLCCYRLF